MRDSVVKKALVGLVLAAGLALSACGGGGSEQRTADWHPHERTPSGSPHWWWEPVERTCENDGDCQNGESCQAMRLGTCEGCPHGETAHVCVGRDGNAGRQASSH